MGKIKVVMNKPVYLSQAILDLSKIVMYEFHYDYMKPKYDGENLKLCYMDTDSLVYKIKTEDFYAESLKTLQLGLIPLVTVLMGIMYLGPPGGPIDLFQ